MYSLRRASVYSQGQHPWTQSGLANSAHRSVLAKQAHGMQTYKYVCMYVYTIFVSMESCHEVHGKRTLMQGTVSYKCKVHEMLHHQLLTVTLLHGATAVLTSLLGQQVLLLRVGADSRPAARFTYSMYIIIGSCAEHLAHRIHHWAASALPSCPTPKQTSVTQQQPQSADKPI